MISSRKGWPVAKSGYRVSGSRIQSGDIDGAAEVVSGAEPVGGRVGDDFVEERLAGREIRVSRQRQPHPIRRVDERRLGAAGLVEAGIALGRRGSRHFKLVGADP